jgi:hypothetical protein
MLESLILRDGRRLVYSVAGPAAMNFRAVRGHC